MANKPDIVQIKLDSDRNSLSDQPTKAFQMRIDDNKTVVVYNRIQNYVLEALMKAVFDNAH
ncbi:hypothetical protein [Lapidilactobacillus bayanensis]|uniref:hypothetical protein n=1 Tax=Lapidilactobacillus bayanensis TaxID=2485998 RepID=UPI000F7B7CA1|nr:hypothetical protein [Lapidilactobacillus bayanensis]